VKGSLSSSAPWHTRVKVCAKCSSIPPFEKTARRLTVMDTLSPFTQCITVSVSMGVTRMGTGTACPATTLTSSPPTMAQHFSKERRLGGAVLMNVGEEWGANVVEVSRCCLPMTRAS